MQVRKKILLIGPMPPPSGGVSVHLSRLLKKSKEHPNLELAVFDLRKFKLYRSDESIGNIISAFFFLLSAKMVHIHLSHPVKVFIARVCRLFGKMVIYTQHNHREWKNPSSQAMIRLASKIILVFDPGQLPANGKVIPAFIPSFEKGNLPTNLESKIAAFKKVIVSVRSDVSLKHGEEDLYGFDILLEALKGISFYEKTLLLLVAPSDSSFKRYEKKIKAVQEHSGIEILYIDSEVNFSALLSKSDLFIRATRSDGDSLSVREALQAGVSVIASDCIKRPDGCFLFQSGNSVELGKLIVQKLQNTERHIFQQRDFSEDVFKEYY